MLRATTTHLKRQVLKKKETLKRYLAVETFTLRLGGRGCFIHEPSNCSHAYMHIGAHRSIYARMYAYMPAFMHIGAHSSIYARMYAYVHAYMHIGAHVCTYAHIYAYMHAYMHI